MEKIEIYFKSDFTVILASEAQWGGCPFRLNFYTASPSRSFVACYDGENYHNCRLLEDGRLEVAINQKDGNVQALMGIGTLTVAPEFYLDNDAFRDHVCNQFVKPFVPTFEDEEGNEYQVNLSLNGVSTLVTYGTLPAFYQKGDTGEKGEQGLPGRDADIAAAEAATERANTAATKANQSAENANTTASQVREEYDEWLQEQDVEIASAINIVKDAGQAQIVACEAAEESANNAALNATNEAAKIAPAISSMQSTFDAQEAARQRSATDQRAAEAAVFASKEAQRDAAIEEATKVSSKVDTLGQKVDELEKRPIGGGGGAFPEAPTDGEAYGRVNGEWGKVLKKPSVEVTEIPVTLTLDDDIGGYSGDKFIDTGEVIVNGERYSCQQGNFMGLTCYGNLSLIGETGGENVPFFYVDYSVTGVPMAVISTIDIHSFSFVGEALTNLIPISNIETENAWEELVENKWKATSDFSSNYRNSWRVNGPKAGDTLHVKYKINPDFPSADPDYSTVGEFIKDRFPMYEQFLEFEDDLEVIYGGNYNPPTEDYILPPMAYFAEGMCFFVTNVVSVLLVEGVLSSYDDINNPNFIDIKFGYCKNTDTTPMPSTISGKDKKRDVFYVIKDNKNRFFISITPTNIKRDTVYIVKYPLSELDVQFNNYGFENWNVNPNEVTIIFETGSDVSNFLELRHPGIDVRIVGELTIEPNTSYMMSIFCNTIVLSELNEAQ